MKLKRIKAFGKTFDLEVTRHGRNVEMLVISRGKSILKTKLIKDKQVVVVL